INDRRARAEQGNDQVLHPALQRVSRVRAKSVRAVMNRAIEALIISIAAAGRPATIGRYSAAEARAPKNAAASTAASTDSDETRPIRMAVKPWVGRKPLASRPFGPKSSIVPASPASPPEIRKARMAMRPTFAPCHVTITGLRPARPDSRPKAVRRVSHQPSRTTAAAIPTITAEVPADAEIRC